MQAEHAANQYPSLLNEQDIVAFSDNIVVPNKLIPFDVNHFAINGNIKGIRISIMYGERPADVAIDIAPNINIQLAKPNLRFWRVSLSFR